MYSSPSGIAIYTVLGRRGECTTSGKTGGSRAWGWEDYGSEGFSHPPPELFGFNQVRDAVFGDAEYHYACCGGESSDNSDDDSDDDDDEAEAEAAVAGA